MKIKRSTCIDRTKFYSSNLRIIGQANSQLILCLLREQRLMLVFDQHAVHERIRYERLVTDAYDSRGQIAVRKVVPPMEFNIPQEISSIVEDRKQLLQSYLGLDVSLKSKQSQDGQPILIVRQIPCCFRNFTELGPFLDFLNESLNYVQKANDDNQQSIKLTPFLLDQVKTQACRGAIRFNEFLTKPAMTELIRALSLCKMGFRCAHGRVLVKPLIYLPSSNKQSQENNDSDNDEQIRIGQELDSSTINWLNSIKTTVEKRVSKQLPKTREQFLKLVNSDKESAMA